MRRRGSRRRRSRTRTSRSRTTSRSSPSLNKIDLPQADPDAAAKEVSELIGDTPDHVLRISAKTGEGVADVLDAVVERIAAPSGDPAAPARALVFDSSYDQYRGVVAFVRVVDGVFKSGDGLRAMAQKTEFDAEELGFMSPTMRPVKELTAGEVGYVVTGLKDVSRLRVGDTLTSVARPAAEALPGYKDVKPMVFAGLFPTDSDQYPELRDALERLKLNDASLFYEPENSQALGFGFRAGFLGLLHMEIVRERLEREFDLDLLVTAPNVAYRVTTKAGEHVEVHNPSEMPRELEEVEEPYVKASIIVPKEHVGAVMELNNDRRGAFDHMEYLSEERVMLSYDLPLGEIVLDYYDQLKSRTRGYASFDYDYAGFRPGKLERVDILDRRRAGRRALADHPPRRRLRPGPGFGRAAAPGDPAPVLRRPDPGGDRLARDRPRDGEGEAQGRARQVLRRRHLPEAQAAREAEEGQEADEAGRRRRGAAGGIPRRAQSRQGEEVVVALEMKGVCERCGVGLEPSGPAAICSFECTFCVECAEAMEHVCPNCAGELVARPRRVA